MFQEKPESVEGDEEETQEEEAEENDETGQDPVPVAEEKTEEAPAAPQPTNELKIVIVVKDENALIGVQSPDCDPVYEKRTGSLSAIMKQVPGIVKKARDKWATNPKNPKANLPEPPPAPTPAPAPRAASKPQPTGQPSFF